MDAATRIRIRQLPHGRGLELPGYATEGAAGMDVRAAVDEPVVIAPGAVDLIPTGLEMEVPPGYEIQVRPRSGLALRNRVTLLNTPGTIDSDYRGEVKVIVANLGSEAFRIERGDRIAQLVLAPVARAEWEPVTTLDHTPRGPGGFGHTGTR
ncbi:MAG: dUTP diphosphatase [Armatimonadia bacterium]|nr:dUTP diphosphatase [Armatimonadia bacterium]